MRKAAPREGTALGARAQCAEALLEGWWKAWRSGSPRREGGSEGKEGQSQAILQDRRASEGGDHGLFWGSGEP